MDNEVIVKDIFTNLENPAAYSGLKNVFTEAKRKNKNITRSQVLNELQKLKTWTLHKPRRLRFKRLRTIPSGYMTDIQADLADFQKLKEENDGFSYLLVAIDVLSRQIFVEPTKSKSSKDMIKAFDKLFSKMPALPFHLFTDKGVEFEANEMKNYFEKKQIAKYVTQSPDVKASLAERCIRTVKGRLYKYFTQTESLRWIEAVQKIVKGINNSINRNIGVKPSSINKENSAQLWDKLYLNSLETMKTSPHKAPKYNEGDTVRISKEKGTFEKGYLPNYSNEIFIIDRVKDIPYPNYRLVDLKGEEVLGKFYNEELSKTDIAQLKAVQKTLRDYTIEKVLRKRTRAGKPEYYVKWKGLPLKMATWIRRSDIV